MVMLSGPSLPSPDTVNPAVRGLFFLLLLLLGASVTWAALSPLDAVVIASGRVAPRGFVQSVQHLEGGILARMAVKEGDAVEKGQLLARMEGVSSSADLAEIDTAITALNFDLLRLQAEIRQESVLTLPEPADDLADTLRREVIERFQARRQALASALAVQDSEAESLKLDQQRSRARLENLQRQRSLLVEQESILEKGQSQGDASQFDLLELRKELGALDTELANEQGVRLRLNESLNLAEEKRRQVLANFRDGVTRDLSESRRSLQGLQERRLKLLDNVQRTVLRAPKGGIIRTVYYKTVGGVVPPGGTLLDIVPQESGVLVEAKVNPRDIGLVRPGLDARLTLTSSDAALYGSITGVVTVVSPDTVRDSANSPPYYLVQIDTPERIFQGAHSEYPLVPGVELAVGLVIGQRTVLTYLLSPFRQTVGFALSER